MKWVQLLYFHVEKHFLLTLRWKCCRLRLAYDFMEKNNKILEAKGRSIQRRAEMFICLVLWFIILGGFFILCHLFPICSDDYGNHFMYEGGSGTISWLPERVETILDVFRSSITYYFSWGGRFVAGVIFQTLLLLDKWVYDILNVICYLLLSMLVCKVSKCVTWRASIMVGLSFWLIMPAPGSSLIWLTGSVNYLWMSVLILIFLCCLFAESKWGQWFAVPLGFLAGNSHEGISSGIIIALVLYASLFRYRRSVIFYIALLSFIVGFLSNVMSPGTSVRMGTDAIAEQSIICKIGEAYLKSVRARFYLTEGGWLTWMNFLWAPLAFVIATWGTAEIEIERRRLVQSMSVGAFICTLLIMFASGEGYSRAYYGPAFIGYTGLAIVVLPLLGKLRVFPITGLFFVLALLNGFEFCKARHQISLLGRYEETIRALAVRNSMVIVPQEFRGRVTGRYIEAYGKFSDMLHPSSKALAYYLGIPEVAVFSDEKEIQMVENSANFDDLEVGQFRRIGSGWYLLRLRARPADVKGRRLCTPQPDQLTGFWGVILNEALRERVSDFVGTSTFCRNGCYYVQVKTQDDLEVAVRYVDGSAEEYRLIVPDVSPLQCDRP